MKTLFVLTAALAALAGCGDTLKGTEYAEATVAKFREQMKARQFEQIYDSTGADFKAATSRETAPFSSISVSGTPSNSVFDCSL